MIDGFRVTADVFLYYEDDEGIEQEKKIEVAGLVSRRGDEVEILEFREGLLLVTLAELRKRFPRSDEQWCNWIDECEAKLLEEGLG